jgi:hypothetical protein
VVRALATHPEVLGQLLLIQNLITGRTLDPQTFWDATGFSRGDDWLARLLEPGHKDSSLDILTKVGQDARGPVR